MWGRKKQRKVIDLEMLGPARQSRQNPDPKKARDFCIVYVIAWINWEISVREHFPELIPYLPLPDSCHTASPVHWLCFHPYFLLGIIPLVFLDTLWATRKFSAQNSICLYDPFLSHGKKLSRQRKRSPDYLMKACAFLPICSPESITLVLIVCVLVR